jgi:hypothetical protein
MQAGSRLPLPQQPQVRQRSPLIGTDIPSRTHMLFHRILPRHTLARLFLIRLSFLELVLPRHTPARLFLIRLSLSGLLITAWLRLRLSIRVRMSTRTNGGGQRRLPHICRLSRKNR